MEERRSMLRFPNRDGFENELLIMDLDSISSLLYL